MKYTLSAFYNAAQAQNTNDVVCPVLIDDSIPTSNNRLFPSEDRKLLAAYVAGADLTIARLDSATLLLNGRPVINPVDSGAIGGNLTPYIWYGERGLVIPKQEQLGLLLSRAGAAPAITMGLIFHGAMTPAPPGPVKTVRATSAITLVAGQWVLGNIVLDTQLSVGNYAIVGMSATGANLIAARLVIPGYPERPGIIASQAVAEYQLASWRNGNPGLLGVFQNYNIPQIQVLGVGAGAAQELFLDIIKVG
jgi:hypothetical protein